MGTEGFWVNPLEQTCTNEPFCVVLFRLLQISSFNGKMNALNEVNKVIANVSFHASRQIEEDEWLTAVKMAVREESFPGCIWRSLAEMV